MQENEKFPKEKYQKIMAANLAMLRTRMGLNQEDLAEYIGASRQMISLIERGVRPMMWDTFLALMFLFTSNDVTRNLMPVLGLQTPELMKFLNRVNLGKLL